MRSELEAELEAYQSLDDAMASAVAASARRSPTEIASHRFALERAREEARRFLARRWTLALRGPVSEPHGPEWDSGVRMMVAEALAARLLAFGVDSDLVALLLSGWAVTYTDPPLGDEAILSLVRGLAPLAEEAAA